MKAGPRHPGRQSVHARLDPDTQETGCMCKLDPDTQGDRVYMCKDGPRHPGDRVYTCAKLDPDT